MENLFENFGLTCLVGWFLPILFLGQAVFLLIVGRQICLMNDLYKTNFDFLLKGGNWLLLVLVSSGLIISLVFNI